MSNSKLTTNKCTECIAVIGMSGRFPGARNLDEFWQNLRNGVESVSFFSDQELEASGIDQANLDNPNYIRAGAILEDVGLFDADFFGISAREAACLDPQHRLLLECAWEALEYAGYSPNTYTGSIGVYAGSRISEYLLCNLPIPDMAGLNVASGPLVSNWKRVLDNDKDTLATRIAYKLDLKGPAIAMQTACSTSLVAVHMACQSLLREDCDIILAGGVCVRVPQKAGYLYSEGLIFSPDGHTRAFDAKGGGTIFSSGVGMVALKRLDKALADGDCIQAVIRGSAVNNDGDAMKAAFTSPSVEGQVEVICKALSAANVHPGSLSYIEAHGTATTHGDLTEMSSLTKAFRSGTDMNGYCALGSVKTNIGHPTQAAGIIGLIKTVLMLKHKMLVPHLHFEKPNPQIDFAGSPFFINTKLTEWKATHFPRRAGVNSFGVGGTNAHVILEEAPLEKCNSAESDRPTHILCLSAKSHAALHALARRYEHFFELNQQTPIANVCYTANTGRTHFSHRLSVIADSSPAMREKLSAIASGNHPHTLPETNVTDCDRPMIAFLFSGQGSQYIDMGRQLFATQPRFRKTMEQCDRLLRPYLKKPLLSVLYPHQGTAPDVQKIAPAGQLSGTLDETVYTQTALFAVEYSLYELWKSWGVVPDVVMGHSIGEYAAACAAGVFDLEVALKLVAERGRLMQGLAGNGAMAAVFANAATVKKYVQSYADKVSIAALNGPENVVISGNQEAVLALLKELQQEGIKGQRLTVSNAFHSPLVDPILDSFEQLAAKVNYNPPQIKIISNVTGLQMEGQKVFSASYWRRHLREPVKFADSMEKLTALGCNTFIELGPDSTLLSMGLHCTNHNGDWLASLRKNRNDWPQMLHSLGTLYNKGIAVDWSGFDQDYPRRRAILPTYPFQHKRYWIERNNTATKPERKAHSRFTHTAASSHPLLGQRLPSALKEIQFESLLHSESTLFLQDHHAFGSVIFPATGFIEMVLEAAAEISPARGQYVVKDLEIREALILPSDESVLVHLILTPEGAQGYSFRIFSLPANKRDPNASWKTHTTGLIFTGPLDSSLPQFSLQSIRERCRDELSVRSLYLKSQESGITHGPNFQAVEKLWQGDSEALAHIRLPEELSMDAENYQVHPVLLDACLHIGKATFPGYNDQSNHEDIFLPTIFEGIHIYDPLESGLWSYTILRKGDNAKPEIRTIDFFIFNSQGHVVAEVQGLHFKRASRESLLRISDHESVNNWLYEIKWQAKSLPVAEPIKPDQHGIWLIFSDRNGVSTELVRQLRDYGETCIRVFPGEFSTRIEQESCQVNPSLAEDFIKLHAHVLSLPGTLRGVVHLWGLEKSFAENDSPMDTQIIDCASGLHLIQALVKEGSAGQPCLYFVTRGTQPVLPEDHPLAVEHNPLWGLGRVAAREHPELHCTLIDLDPAGRQGEDALLFKELWSTNKENQVGFRLQQRYVSRLTRDTESLKIETRLKVPNCPRFRLEPSSSGILNNISFRELERLEPASEEVEICVHATGLNFRDVLSVLGKYPGDPGPLGRECSGTISAIGDAVNGLKVGDAVLAIAPGSFSNYVMTNAHFVVLKPDFLSFEDSASIPITFLTAYYGLYHLANLKAGEKVLIHAASGGVGLAAVQLVKWMGAEIFATASQGKWAYLKKIGIKHIMNSRSLDFAAEVMQLTDGQGVDVVLNSLAGDFIPKSLSVLAAQGRFIEIGKAGIWNDKQIADIRPDITYFPFDLGNIAHQEPEFFQSMFQKLMAGFQHGPLKPLPQKCFPIEDSIKAFRYMAQAKHIGKIIVYQQGSRGETGQKETSVLRANHGYLITGGFGALGLQVAAWLAAQNVRYIVLVGRKGPSDQALKVIRKLEKDGCLVHIAQADVSNRDQIAQVLKHISDTMPPLRGIIHAAGVLDDGVLIQQTWERFTKVMEPKVTGAWNLHVLTQTMPLDFFILFSSVSSLWGTPGQANYSAANAFLDGLAHYRHAQRLPCVSVNWGSWAEVGMAATLNSNIQQRRKTRGLGTINLEAGLKILACLIGSDSAQSAVINVNWVDYIKQFPAGDVPPFFSYLLKENRPVAKEKNVPHYAEQSGLLDQVRNSPASQRQQIVSSYVSKEIAKLLGYDQGQTLDVQHPLKELGLDSLSAIELRNAFESSIGCTLPATLLYEYPTIADASNYLTEKISQKKPIPDAHSKLPRHHNESLKVLHKSYGKSSNLKETSCAEQQPEHSQKNALPLMKPLNTKGSKPPLFMLHVAPLSIHLSLGAEQPIYFFRGLWEKESLLSEIRIEEIATAFIKQIKTVQPQGPYYLGGGSIGGLIAFEMAQQLIRQGEQIALLFLIEPTTPIKFTSQEKGLNLFKYKMAKGGIKEIIRKTLPDPAIFSNDNMRLLQSLTAKKFFANTYPGRLFMHNIQQAIINSGLPLPSAFRETYVYNLYAIAQWNYFAHTYPGQIVVYKVKQMSTVDGFIWQQLATGRAEIKELDLTNHHDIFSAENDSVWINDLKNYLAKAHTSYATKTK